MYSRRGRFGAKCIGYCPRVKGFAKSYYETLAMELKKSPFFTYMSSTLLIQLLLYRHGSSLPLYAQTICPVARVVSRCPAFLDKPLLGAYSHDTFYTYSDQPYCFSSSERRRLGQFNWQDYLHTENRDSPDNIPRPHTRTRNSTTRPERNPPRITRFSGKQQSK